MDPLIASALIGGGVNIFSALSAQRGQERANVDQMAFNAQEAQKDRDFQERMSSSSYQRARKDLEAAGYNPLLAFPHPASTPAGAVASAQPQSITRDSSRIFSETARNVADLRLTQSMIDKVGAEADTAKAVARMENQQADFWTGQFGRRLMMFKNVMGSGVGQVLNTLGHLGGAKIISDRIRGAKIDIPRPRLSAAADARRIREQLNREGRTKLSEKEFGY